MSTLEYGVEGSSPNDEIFNYEKILGNSCNERARSRNSLNAGKYRSLRIEVPCAAGDSEALRDVFQYQGSDGSTGLSPEFNNITHLPTPIMPSSAIFQNSVPSRDSIQPHHQISQLVVMKRQTVHASADRSMRVVSEFEPEAHSKHCTSPSNISSALPLNRRHISNPRDRYSAHSPVETPSSPPPESQNTEFKGRVLLAPKLNRSYVCERVVGQGSFSTVVAARDSSDASSVVAVKVISYPTDDDTTASSFRSYIVRELGVLSHLNHPCIIKLLDYNVSPPVTNAEIDAVYDSVVTPDNGQENETHGPDFATRQQCLFLEFNSGGNLFDYISNTYEKYSHTQAFWRLMARVVAEIVVAVAYMHQNRVIHRDIKLENVLLTENHDLFNDDSDPRLSSRPSAILTDFGLSKRLSSDDQELTTKCGSQDYVSPELLMGLEYNGKLLDSWAVGVLVYSIIENRLPFDLPPPDLMHASGISPSILKRRNSRRSPAHRIAMIDWAWYRANEINSDEILDLESTNIVSNLKKLVETFLVRKDRRVTIEEALESDAFTWIKACVPTNFYS